MKINKKLVILTIILIIGAFYWYQWRPYQTIKECHKTMISDIQRRHDENLDYYFESFDSKTNSDSGAGKNIPMYVKDLNARLDQYWGDIVFSNCMHYHGMLVK